MKKLSFLLILATFLAFSCTKEETKSVSPIVGEWRWVSSTGGIAGKTLTPTSEGYERKLVLTSDFKFSRYKDNLLAKSGTYTISQAKSIYKIEMVDFVNFSDGTNAVILSQSASELSLADNFFDGFTETFQPFKK